MKLWDYPVNEHKLLLLRSNYEGVCQSPFRQQSHYHRLATHLAIALAIFLVPRECHRNLVANLLSLDRARPEAYQHSFADGIRYTALQRTILGHPETPNSLDHLPMDSDK